VNESSPVEYKGKLELPREIIRGSAKASSPGNRAVFNCKKPPPELLPWQQFWGREETVSLPIADSNEVMGT